MQPSRGGGGAAELLGIDGLVLALVFELFGDVGRQRHFAERVELFVQRLGIIGKGDELVALGQRFVHGGRQAAVAERKPRARLHAAARAGQTLPGVAVHLAQQQHFAHGAGGHLGADEPRGQHLGIVEHKHVARFEIIGQVAENFVLDGIVLPRKDHQPGAVARVGGFLGDEFFGQVVPEVFF